MDNKYEKYRTMRHLYLLDVNDILKIVYDLDTNIAQLERKIEQLENELLEKKQMQDTCNTLLNERLNFKPLDKLVNEIDDKQYLDYQELERFIISKLQ